MIIGQTLALFSHENYLTYRKREIEPHLQLVTTDEVKNKLISTCGKSEIFDRTEDYNQVKIELSGPRRALMKYMINQWKMWEQSEKGEIYLF